MEFQDVVRRRRMIRRYDDRPVAAAVVDRMVSNAQRAPSAGFSQGWAFLVLDTPEDVARFWDATTPSSVEVRAESSVEVRAESSESSVEVRAESSESSVEVRAESSESSVEVRAERASKPDSTPHEDTTPNRWLDGMRTAPVVIVPLASRDAYLERYAEPDKGWTDRDEARWPTPFWFVDTGMASLLILQTAVDEGLGACFFGIPPEQIQPFREAFDVPGEYHPIGAITVGHRVPDAGAPGSPARRERRTNVVHRGRWSNST